MKVIIYQEGYKYQLYQDYTGMTDITGYNVDDKWFTLRPDGEICIRAGYAWDGSSGPALDTDSSMRASVVHDALYQMMREGLLPQECFTPSNKEYKKICLEDGMWKIVAWWRFRAIESFGSAAAAKQRDKVLTSPTGRTYA